MHFRDMGNLSVVLWRIIHDRGRLFMGFGKVLVLALPLVFAMLHPIPL